MSKKRKKFNKIVASTITASVATSAIVTLAPNVDAASIKFNDVSSNSYFSDAVNSLSARNIIKGYGDGTFRPQNSITRAEAATIIAQALDLDTSNIEDPRFKDVSKDNWAYQYIAALANKGIIVGYDGEFKPNDPLTRAQMAKIISVAYNFQPSDSQELPFTDVKKGDWFSEYVGALVENDITSGTTPTTFSPSKIVTRGQIASFVYRSENSVAPVQVNETISTITNETLVTSEGTYTLTDEQKKWMNPSNLAALSGATIKLTAKNNKIEQIQLIDFTAKGSSSTDTANPYANHIVFDGKGATVDANITINGDYFTMQNVTIKGDLHVGKGVENSFFSEFTKVEGKTTIDDSLQIVNQTAQNYKSLGVKLASTNSFPIVANETITKGRVVFSEFQLGDVDVDKNADVIFLSKTVGTSTVGEIVVNSNATITSDSSVTIPKLLITSEAKDVTINSTVTSLQVTAVGELKLSGKADIVNLSVTTNANVNLQTQGKVGTLETGNKDTKITLGTGTKVNNLVVPTGAKPSDIIGNYETTKGNVEQIGGTKNPDITPPSNNGGGSSGGSTSIPVAPAAPQGLQGIAPSVLLNDGKITGLISTKSYQYKLATASTWTNVAASSTQITGLTAGNYEVRIAANGNTPASSAITVVVASYQSQPINSLNISIGNTGVISGDTVTNGETLKYLLVNQSKATVIASWNTLTLEADADTALGGTLSTTRPTLTTADNSKYLVVVGFKNGKAISAGESTSINIETLGSLNVIANDDPFSNDKTVITAGTADTGNEFAYKVFDDANAADLEKPALNADVSSWTVLPQDGKITAVDGKVVVVVERTATGKLAKKVGQVSAVTTVNNQLLEAVMLDGKDGVSSQDGEVETIRLKFSGKFDPNAAIPNNMFTVPGFSVESIKVTDKNGRTPKLSNGTDNPLYTQGESQYITIRLAPRTGTNQPPLVTQNPNSVITDLNGVEITGINVQAVDQAAPVIISSSLVDNGSNGVNAGDQITITFSEDINLVPGANVTDLMDDFTLSNSTHPNFEFNQYDQFSLLGNTVTVTLGEQTAAKLLPGTTITMNSDGNYISLFDSVGNKAKPQKLYVSETTYSNPKAIDIIGNFETLGNLNVTANDDPFSNDKTIITAGTADTGNEFAYKVFDDANAANLGTPVLNADVTSWTTLLPDGKIPADNGKVIVVVERTATGKLAKKVGQVNAVTVVNNQLLEAVMIDGKDGVSSQDGEVETIRLKFSANIDLMTVNINSFTVNGFTVESVKVTDKNGRTPYLSNGTTPNPLYTQGENQYVTIRVTPQNGTAFTPTVTQNSNSVIRDIYGVEITGIDIQAKDTAAPVIISSVFIDNDSEGMNAGDQITITFSEAVIPALGMNVTNLVDDFTLYNSTHSEFTFNSSDQFSLLGNTVTVTLGATTVANITQGTTITMNSDGSAISLMDNVFNKAKPQKVFVNENVYSDAKTIDIISIPTPSVNAIDAPTASKVQGNDAGTIKLTGLTDGDTYEYIIDNNPTTSVSTDWTGALPVTLSSKTEIDNISVNAGQYVHIRVKPTGSQTANVQDLQIALIDIKPDAAPNPNVDLGSSAGSTKLTGLEEDVIYQYIVDTNQTLDDNAIGWQEATADGDGYINNIPADSSKYIHIRVKATTQKPASYIKSVKGYEGP
ncbi:S-layer homology domain-containing protein [Lysinibacillus antri]|nr:S-layer homology domain-containing protein [Lysinibacillus antri]